MTIQPVIYGRAHYNAPPLGDPDRMVVQSSPTEAFLHHTDDPTGDGFTFTTKVKQSAKVRAIDDFHRNGRGWAMGGYHWVVFQKTGEVNLARAYELRPAHYVPAAQLGHNTGTLAIVVVGNGEHDPLYESTEVLIAELIKRQRMIRSLGGHRDVVSTECPGDRFYGHVPHIAKLAKVRVHG